MSAPRESPWRPVTWERRYRFPDLRIVVTVKAEMERDDYATAIADAQHFYGLRSPEAIDHVWRRLEVRTHAAARKAAANSSPSPRP